MGVMGIGMQDKVRNNGSHLYVINAEGMKWVVCISVNYEIKLSKHMRRAAAWCDAL